VIDFYCGLWFFVLFWVCIPSLLFGLVWFGFFLFFVCKFLLRIHFEDFVAIFIFFVEHKFCRERTKVGCFFCFFTLAFMFWV
jgi:hypothetical protein